MPSINGIEIRGLHQEETHRGIAYEAELYIDGFKIGYFENKGLGGSTSIEIVKDNRVEFQNRIQSYYQKNPSLLENEEQFIEELMYLYDDYEMFVSHAQSENKLLVALKSYTRMTPFDEISMGELMPKYYVVNDIEHANTLISLEEPKEYKVYQSLNDFDI